MFGSLSGNVAKAGRRLRRIVRKSVAAYRKRARPQVISHHGVKLPLSGAISEEMRAILYAGSYEEREHEVLSTLLGSGDRVLELGAGLGFITVVCAQRCGSEAVTTVEANPRMLDTLRAVFRCNRVSPRLVHGAVSARGAAQKLFINQNFWSTSTYDRGGEPAEVPGLAFEQLLAEHRPTVLVIDIEGGELQLIGASIDPRVRAIVIELHAAVTGSEGAARVRAWLHEQGFVAVRDFGDRSVVVLERRTTDPARR